MLRIFTVNDYARISATAAMLAGHVSFFGSTTACRGLKVDRDVQLEFTDQRHDVPTTD
jgi:hypothetical protein